MTILPWRGSAPVEIARTRIVTLHSQRFVSASDPTRGGDFTVLKFPDWINVLAITRRRELVMVEQFRFGIAVVTLEIPGGVVEPGESPAAACVRELTEETGYGPGPGSPPIRMLGKTSANPAVQDNWVYTGLLTGVERVAGPSPDEHEEIAVRLVPLERVSTMVRSGEVHHALIVAALHLLMVHGSDILSA